MGLYSRQAFNADKLGYQTEVSAVVSMHMNSLKGLNDTQGHHAGDKASRLVGQCLHERASADVIPYRMVGDGFLSILMQMSMEDVFVTVGQVKKVR